MMVMKHNGEKRCPFCLSRRLRVIDNDLAPERFWKTLGAFWFQLKCTRCGGICEDINNLESKADLKRKAEANQNVGEAQNDEKISVHGE